MAMKKEGVALPRVEVRPDLPPAEGVNTYTAIPETVEYRRLDLPPSRTLTLGLGRLAVGITAESREIASLFCHVKTGRWRTEGVEPPPEPDYEAGIAILQDFGEDGLVFLPLEPRFLWHEESRSLRLSLAEGTALVIRAANCLLAGIDAAGCLTDFWLLDLNLET